MLNKKKRETKSGTEHKLKETKEKKGKLKEEWRRRGKKKRIKKKQTEILWNADQIKQTGTIVAIVND